MQTNIGKVMERGEKLEDLQDKSGVYTIRCRFRGRPSVEACCPVKRNLRLVNELMIQTIIV
jgi:hypothetical protein